MVASLKYVSILWGLLANTAGLEVSSSLVPALSITITDVIALLSVRLSHYKTYLFSNVVAALKYGSIRWGMPAASLERSFRTELTVLDAEIIALLSVRLSH